jgi:hypothetical protein
MADGGWQMAERRGQMAEAARVGVAISEAANSAQRCHQRSRHRAQRRHQRSV